MVPVDPAAGKLTRVVRQQDKAMTGCSYSPVLSLAVLSAALGITTVLGLLAPEFATVALPGIVLGFFALAAIRKLSCQVYDND